MSTALNAKQAETLRMVASGSYASAHLGTLKALRSRGLLTFKVETERRRFGRTVGSITVTATLTPAGLAAL